MFGLGFTEILIILVVALLVLGPKRLPDIAKQLGKGLREFRRATDDLKSELDVHLDADADQSARAAARNPSGGALPPGGPSDPTGSSPPGEPGTPAGDPGEPTSRP